MKPLLLLVMSGVLLSGCWDMKEAQNVNFITALGVEYVDDHYVIYAQLINFPAISTQNDSGSGSTGKSQSPRSAWVGKGEGTSIILALNDVYESSQQQTFWTHVKAIILSESVLDSKLDEVFSGLLGAREMRYTPWVYATDGSIPELLSAVTLINLSSQTTELFEPVDVYKQRSAVEPVHLQKLLNAVREPGASILLPSITSRNLIWSQKGNYPPLIRTDGVYVLSKNKNQGLVLERDIQGARYVKFERVYRYPLELHMEDGQKVIVLVRDPRASVSAKRDEDKIKFHIRVKSRVYVIESDSTKSLSEQEVRRLTEEKIKEQIAAAFEMSQKRKLDIFGFEEELYRHHHSVWRELANTTESSMLSAFELEPAEVHVQVIHTSTFTAF